MNNYKEIRFIKLFIRFTIVFFIVIMLFKLIIGFFRFEGIEGLNNEYFIDGKWQPFIQLQVVMSLAYGLFIAIYYKFIKK
jgi:purine-cytosine permease-like protein